MMSFLLKSTCLVNAQTVSSWQTSTNKSKLFQKQSNVQFVDGAGTNSTKIMINPALKYQTIEGFGWTMTQGSAYMIMQLSESERHNLLEELFSVEKGLGSATIRVALGASDLGQGAYTYQDDRNKAFNLVGPDLEYLIPVLQQIVQINPNVKFLASPWSAPAWMKTTYNGKQQLRGGKLKKEHFVDYAQYILNYFKEMEKLGLKFHSMTIQNEPLTEHNWPSMYMSKEDQYDFVENYLGPILTNNGYGYIKLIGYDHNCDNTEYPIYVARSQYIEGSAFHLYGGSIAALSTVYNATKKSVYFTEQWTDGNGDFGSDFAYHLQQIMLGTVNNMGKIALEWNVASDQNWDPHTNDGGCDRCMGAITIHNQTKTIAKNVTYYTVAHMSKVTRYGSVRIASTGSNANDMSFAAFQNPDNTYSIVLYNSSSSTKSFDIVFQNKSFSYTLSGKTAISYLWKDDVVNPPEPTNSFSEIYNLLAVHSNKGLDVKDGLKTAGAAVQQWEISNDNQFNGDNQRWLFESAGENKFYIQSKHSGFFLTAGGVEDGAKITLEQLVKSPAQTWEVTMIETDNYRIVNDMAKKAMDVSGPSINNGAEVHLWTYYGNDNQKWKFVEVEKRSTLQAKVQREDNFFKAFPNPFTTTLNIFFDKPAERTIQIFSISGTLLFSHLSSEQSFVLNTKLFSEGAYLLKVQDNNSYSVVRMLKQVNNLF